MRLRQLGLALMGGRTRRLCSPPAVASAFYICEYILVVFFFAVSAISGAAGVQQDGKAVTDKVKESK